MLAAIPNEARRRRDLFWSTRSSFFGTYKVFRGKLALQEPGYSLCSFIGIIFLITSRCPSDMD
jgi:hypothetical protein